MELGDYGTWSQQPTNKWLKKNVSVHGSLLQRKSLTGMKPSDSGFYSHLEIKEEEQDYEYISHFSDICGGVGYALFFVYLK